MKGTDLRSKLANKQQPTPAPSIDASPEPQQQLSSTQMQQTQNALQQLQQYENMAPDQVWGEALRMAAQQRAAGALSDATLDALAAQLAPMLDASAQARMQQMLEVVKKT